MHIPTQGIQNSLKTNLEGPVRPSGWAHVAKSQFVFGKYETAFNQLILNGSMWIGLDVEQAILPESNFIGVTVLMLQSIETGFGLEIYDEMMKLIN